MYMLRLYNYKENNMTRHYPKHTKNVLDEQYVNGSVRPLIGKDTFNLIFPCSL